jgi:ubiquinone/menaquinone biosynthesis C-methylase UbiE
MTSIEGFFDAEGERYDQAYDGTGTGSRILRERLTAAVELIGDGPGDALDAGMGGGRLCAELDRRGWTVSGVDISAGMVDTARRRLPALRERLLVGSVDALPFADASFDVVAATGVLEYVVQDLIPSVRELARVVRPNGRVVVSFPNHRSPVHLWRGRILYPAARTVKQVLHVGRRMPPRVPLSSVGALETALRAAGLVVEAERLVDVRPRNVPNRRVARLLASQIVLGARRVA